MSSRPWYASGIIIMIACGSERPASTSSSSTLSNVARVGAAGTDDRQDPGEVVAEELRGELRLARAHPVDVAAQRVDLAVVRDHPVRVRELPAREGVRRVAGVHERQRRGRALVLQVRVVGGQLRRRQHALVDHRAGREARDHEVRPGGELGEPADHVQLALEGVRPPAPAPRRRRAAGFAARSRRPTRRPGAGRPGRRARRRRVCPSASTVSARSRSSSSARAASRGQEAHRDAVPAERAAAQRRPRRGTARRGAAAVMPAPSPVQRVGALGAAVLEVAERGQRAHDRLVARGRGRGGRRRRRHRRRARRPGRRGRPPSQACSSRCSSSRLSDVR